LREAFGISEYFVEGTSFDPDRKAKEDITKSEAIQKELAEKETEKANRKRYALVRTPSREKDDNDDDEDGGGGGGGGHKSKEEKKKKKKKNRDGYVQSVMETFSCSKCSTFICLAVHRVRNARRIRRKRRRTKRKGELRCKGKIIFIDILDC
jgi:hypothetical protein